MTKRKTKKQTQSAALDSEEHPESVSVSEGVEDLAAQVASSTPEPNQRFLDADAEAKAERAAEHAHLRDKLGFTFDKDIHLTDGDGQPKLNKDGTLKRKRKRKDSRQSAQDAKAKSLDAHSQLQARQAGVVAANTLIVSCRGLFGDEWQPVQDEMHGIDERNELQSAFGDYFVAKGITDFPPGVALCMAVGMYAAPRFTKPKTQSRVKRLWDSTKRFFGRIRKRGSAARSDNRENKQRENDSSKRTVQTREAA